ncbi:vWA domain-containing protein [Rhizobium tubonense]|uniref:Pilus assembly protein TadG n=1 Tax=Rhizobium tubonense TaxID=484088 RepID=A0A2W4CLG6_9HYPH|nr:pilus assembly protein [Rhizobium tubonense]PZM13712.1 pilus assembly protein TadG [Rhizobium tubonense]
MSIARVLHPILERLVSNRGGNFGIMTALVLPVLLGAGGIAVDVTNEFLAQRQLEQATDAAALAAATALASGTSTIAEAQTLAANFVAGQMSNYATASELAAIKAGTTATAAQTSTGTGSKTYTVKVQASYGVALNGLTQLVGPKTATVGASSSTTSQSASKNAMSMYVVLDRSGSMSFVTDVVQSLTTKCMNFTRDNWVDPPIIPTTKPCYVNKSAALKLAAATLLDQLDAAEAADTTDTLVRTGAVSFTDTMQTTQDIAWGTAGVRTYVSNIPAYPTGGTDMTTAMSTAYQALMDAKETTNQSSKGNTTFSKYIVLMTDGENTGKSSNWNKALDDATLTTCTSAKAAGVTIYTVAFMAPANGKALLLSCAGSASNYYAADDMASLVAAFKDIGQKAADQSTRLTN